jgi:hypothetical protein
MRFKIVGLVLVSFIILTLGCAEKIWLPKSYLKEKNLKREVYKQVKNLDEQDNYFSSFFIIPYVNTVMNSLNNNNGQAIIIAEDGLRYVKFTCILDSDENIYKLDVQQHSKDFGELFKENKIDQIYWIKIIDRFNRGGHKLLYEDPHSRVTLYGDITFVYDFKGDRLLIKHERKDGLGQNSYRIIKIP